MIRIYICVKSIVFLSPMHIFAVYSENTSQVIIFILLTTTPVNVNETLISGSLGVDLTLLSQVLYF